MQANAGDRIVVDGAKVGQGPREGEVLEVLRDNGHEHYRVRWNDGHESIYFPQSDARVVTDEG